MLNDFIEVIRFFQKVVTIKPNWARARFNLEATYMKIGDKDAAIERYEILRGIDPNIPKTYLISFTSRNFRFLIFTKTSIIQGQ